MNHETVPGIASTQCAASRRAGRPRVGPAPRHSNSIIHNPAGTGNRIIATLESTCVPRTHLCRSSDASANDANTARAKSRSRLSRTQSHALNNPNAALLWSAFHPVFCAGDTIPHRVRDLVCPVRPAPSAAKCAQCLLSSSCVTLNHGFRTTTQSAVFTTPCTNSVLRASLAHF